MILDGLEWGQSFIIIFDALNHHCTIILSANAMPYCKFIKCLWFSSYETYKSANVVNVPNINQSLHIVWMPAICLETDLDNPVQKITTR